MKKQRSVDIFPSVGVLLSCATQQWQHAVQEAVGEMGLTTTQCVLLIGLQQLQDRDESVTQAKLSKFVGVDPMLTSKHIRLVEDQRLVVRKHHPEDSRARSLTLTKHGVATVKQVMKAVARIDAELFDAVNSDKLRKQLQNLLGWSS